MSEERSLHAVTWAWWALAGVITLHLAPNPAYVTVVILVAVLVVETAAREGPLTRAFPLLLGAGAVFALLRVVLTALTFHGDGTVLAELPSVTLPSLLGGFTVGGEIVAEVVLRSAAEGLVIVGVVAVFAAFNAVVSHHQLVRAAPRAFHEFGLIVTVGLAFVPATVAAVRAARESDLARTGGETVRRGRLLRLVVPVLEGGMERAMELAASMDARGFGHGGATAGTRRGGWLALAGLLVLAGAFAALVGRSRTVAVVLALVGAAAVIGGVVLVSRAADRPRYRPRRPGRRDAAVAAVAALTPVGVAVLAATGADSLRWSSELGWPAVDPLVLVCLLALLAPVLPAPLSATPAPEVP